MSTYSFKNNFCIDLHIWVQTNTQRATVTLRHLHSIIRINMQWTHEPHTTVWTNQNETLGIYHLHAHNMYRSYSSICRLYSIVYSFIAVQWSCVHVLCCVCSVTDLNTYTLCLVTFQLARQRLSTHLFTFAATWTPDAIHRQTPRQVNKWVTFSFLQLN